MESDSSDKRICPFPFGNVENLKSVSDIPLMDSQGDSAFAMLNSGNVLEVPGVWRSIDLGREVRAEEELCDGEIPPAANILAQTYFSKQINIQ